MTDKKPAPHDADLENMSLDDLRKICLKKTKVLVLGSSSAAKSLILSKLRSFPPNPKTVQVAEEPPKTVQFAQRPPKAAQLAEKLPNNVRFAEGPPKTARFAEEPPKTVRFAEGPQEPETNVYPAAKEAHEDKNTQNNDPYSQLLDALENQDQSTILRICKTGINIQDCVTARGWPLAAESARLNNLSITRLLLSFKADPNMITPKRSWTPLHVAAMARRSSPQALSETLNIVSTLLEARTSIDQPDASGDSALSAACSNRLPEIAEVLLRARANPFVGNNTNGWTSIHRAAYSGDLKSLELMVHSHNVDVDTRAMSHLFDTALHVAAASGELESVDCLVKLRADVHALDSEGRTPLHRAAIFGHSDIISTLLTCKADGNAFEDRDGQTAVMLAVAGGYIDACRLLVQAKADINQPERTNRGWTPLHWAAHRCDVKVVNDLLSLGAIVDARDEHQETPLHVAARAFHVQSSAVIRALISASASPLAADAAGNTPLDLARENNLPSVVALLKETLAPKWFGAALEEDHRALRTMIADGSPVFQPYEGTTLLHEVCARGTVPTLAVLLECATDVNVSDSKAQTPLHRAATRDSPDFVSQLIQVNANLNVQDESGQTALHIAASLGFMETCRALVQAGADMSLRTRGGDSAATMACTAGHVDTLRYLLQFPGQLGTSMLHTAAENCDPMLCALLLEMRADVNIPDEDGNTALHFVVLESDSEDDDDERLETARILVGAGADVTTKNTAGRSSVKLAHKGGHLRIKELFQEAKASKSA